MPKVLCLWPWANCTKVPETRRGKQIFSKDVIQLAEMLLLLLFPSLPLTAMRCQFLQIYRSLSNCAHPLLQHGSAHLPFWKCDNRNIVRDTSVLDPYWRTIQIRKHLAKAINVVSYWISPHGGAIKRMVHHINRIRKISTCSGFTTTRTSMWHMLPEDAC